MKIDSEFIYTISFNEKELHDLLIELYKVDFSENPTISKLYNKLIRS